KITRDAQLPRLDKVIHGPAFAPPATLGKESTFGPLTLKLGLDEALALEHGGGKIKLPPYAPCCMIELGAADHIKLADALGQKSFLPRVAHGCCCSSMPCRKISPSDGPTSRARRCRPTLSSKRRRLL